MPIFWRYLLKNYFKVLTLAVASFIAILLVIRLEEIAQFATIGAQPTYLLLFTLYQIPYILPIAIPISCLLSALTLFGRLSHTHELTALRAAGLSLRSIVAPLLVAGAFLGMGTFYIASELATASHLATRKMVYDLTSGNPLLLLQSAKIARLQNAFIQMTPIRNGAAAQDLVIAINNPSTQRLNLCLAKSIELSGEELIAKQVTLFSSSPSQKGHDHLLIENQKWMSSAALQCASFLRHTGWKIANDHLKFSLLRARMATACKQEDLKALRVLKKCESEVVRRFSVGLASFTFTLMGVVGGIQISRQKSRRGLLIVLVLTALSLIAFCMGKELDHKVEVASLLFLSPHIGILSISLWILSRINRGIE
jgi:lipopolysaccharide export system permease protein